MPPGAAGIDLLILGSGPSGCAAALMAASLDLRSTLIEPQGLCHRLRHIPVIGNVPGVTNGPAYADAIAADLARPLHLITQTNASAR